MVEPIFSDTTEELYAALPAMHRYQDALVDPEFTLKKWISAPGDAVGEVQMLIREITYYPPDEFPAPGEDSSGLADPAIARVEWLPWIGQLVGVNVNPGLPEVEQRAQVAGASSGFRAGTMSALEAAVASLLTGEKYVKIDRHTNDPAHVGEGSQWDILITTLASETPGVDVVASVIAKGAKPAGVILYHVTASTTWDELEVGRPTWAQWDGATWTEIEETGL